MFTCDCIRYGWSSDSWDTEVRTAIRVRREAENKEMVSFGYIC